MPETGRRLPTSAFDARAIPVPADDTGVSPVVGMILVLAISVVGIGAVVYWGLPTIDEMKANVEFRTVEGQFSELDSTIKELIAGTTQRTAKRWQPSISRGEILLREDTQGWLFAMEKAGATRQHIAYANLTDGDDEFVLRNAGDADLASVKVEMYRITPGGEAQLNVTLVGGTTASPGQMSSELTFTKNTEKQFRVTVRNVGTASQATTILDGIYRIKVYSSSTLIGEAWFMNVGAATYSLDAGLGNKAVVLNNGAVMTGSNSDVAIQNAPPIPPPITTGGGYRFFGRAIVFDGSSSFAGLDRFDVLLTLDSMTSLASYDCATSDDCVQSSRICIAGDYRDPWYDYLTNTNLGYNFADQSTTFTGYGVGTVDCIEDREEDEMAYTLLGSIIRVSS